MTRHGLERLSGASLAVALAGNASASVPTSVAFATIKASSLFAAGKAVAAGVIKARVAALTEGVLRAMMLTKLKIATAVLLALGFLGAGLGVGALAYQTRTAAPAAPRGDPEPRKVISDKEPPMQGTWHLVSCKGPDEVF